MKINFNKQTCFPFVLTAVIIAADQLIKALIVKLQPMEGYMIKDLFGNGLVEFWHVRNKAIAFSMGQNIPEALRPVLFIVLPVLVLGFLLWYYFKAADFTKLQRWAVAGIIGGGVGNIIDRIFRPDGVVDFVSVKLPDFIKVFETGRWPTFNIADSSVVVCAIILFVSILFSPKDDEKKKTETKADEKA